MMKKVYIWMVAVLMGTNAHAQVANALKNAGMENIRVVNSEGRQIAAYEDNVYRGTYRGIGKAIEACLACDLREGVELIVLENEVPQLSIVLTDSLMADYRGGKATLEEVYRRMGISVDTDRATKALKGADKINSSAWKADIVVYPQLYLENSRFDRLYMYGVSIGPAVEMQLWKGAMLTAQVLLPVATNTHGEYKKVRPGIVAVAQEWRWKRNFFGRVTAGNFTDNRMGVQAEVKYRTNNGRIEVGALIGSTGYSIMDDDNKWYVGTKQRLNASVKGTLYVPQLNTQLDLQAGRYLYGDVGVRGDCTRHFGEYAVGVYAMCTGGEINGGFHFAIPLPGKKWSRKGPVRVKPSEYFSWVYSMVSWGKYVEEHMGKTYATRTDENKSSRFYQPDFIRYFLIKETMKSSVITQKSK